MPTERVVLITGASSGFGLLTTVTLARRGWRVLATMRDLTRRDRLEAAAQEAGVLDHIEFLALDVTNAAQIAELAASIAARPDPLDAIVNNAGFAMAGFADDVSDAELRRQFDTNFFGAIAVTRAFLPQLRRQGKGHIIMVSSISGRMGFPGIGSYAASKFALEGWAETLRLEMKPLGVRLFWLSRAPLRLTFGLAMPQFPLAQRTRSRPMPRVWPIGGSASRTASPKPTRRRLQTESQRF